MVEEPKETVAAADELRDIYGQPSEIAVRKELTALDGHCRDFLALSPFMVLGSSNAAGRADVSPKGDAPGFVLVLDDTHLLIPDRPGNNRLDTMHNILENPEVAAIFFVPGVGETLRVNGTARIVCDEEVTARFEVNGKAPKTAILIEVREAMMHCAKALVRSRLWDGDYLVDRSALAPSARIYADHTGGGDAAVDKIKENIERSARDRLW